MTLLSTVQEVSDRLPVSAKNICGGLCSVLDSTLSRTCQESTSSKRNELEEFKDIHYKKKSWNCVGAVNYVGALS